MWLDKLDFMGLFIWTAILALIGFDGQAMWLCFFGWLAGGHLIKQLIDRWIGGNCDCRDDAR